MRRKLLSTALALAVCVPVSLRAGTYTNDFTTDPSATHTLSGVAVWNNTGGNPGGYVQLTDALDQQSGAILLPDFDAGKPVKSFTVTMDVMVGGGSDLPGEGWSINFVPPDADVVFNGAYGPGWASDFTPTANLPERGSAQGLGVYALTFDHGGGDILGFNLRYNQVEFVTGGWALPPTGAKHLNGTCTDVYSLQTGTNNPPGVGGLCWAKFSMTMHEGGKIDIYWKGSPVVTNYTTGWAPQPGRWILAARTSTTGTAGGNEVHQFDNIGITTALADKPAISAFTGGPTGFGYDLQDLPGATVNISTAQLTLDGAAVTPTIANKSGTNSVITYKQLLAQGKHVATLSVNTTFGANVTSTNSFYVSAYTAIAIPAGYAATGIDTSKVGFKVRPYETTYASPNTIAWAEGELAGLYGANIADLSSADAQGYYYQTDYINYNINVGAGIGNFLPPDYNEPGPPGIPGSIPNVGTTTANFTEEIVTWLYFPAAGAFTMGVNSDDGFKITSSTNSVFDPNGLLLGQFDAGRGSSDTIFYFTIPAPGYYPFRLLWFNGPGELPGNGANCEWFIQREDGVKVLINDKTKPGAVAAYYGGPSGLPFVQSFSGTVQGFNYVVLDGASSVATASVRTTLNGSSVQPVVNYSAASRSTTIGYTVPGLLPSPSTNVVVLSFQNSAAPVVTQTVTNSFVVSIPVIASSVALTTGVDTTKPGFAVRNYETAAAEPNNIWWMEQQLAGLKGPNIAPNLAASNNGWWTNSDVVNYDATGTGTANGYFNSPSYPDYLFPGQDQTLTAFDNSSAEILTWVNFPASGVYTMGVYDDDGFKVTLGSNPRDQFSYRLGQLVAVTTTLFQFYIPQAGYYPMRLIWENGTGGCHLEWFSVQADGSYVLINDPNTPGSLKAYASGPLATPAYVSLLNPAVGQMDVDPTTLFYVQFTDGSTQVDPTSVTASVNGTAVAGLTVNKVGGITTAQAPMPFVFSGAINTATLTYKEVGSSTPITHTWQYMTTFTEIPASLATPLGSGIASKPGFRVRVDQLPIGFNTTELNPSAEAIEQVLAGLWGPGQGMASSNVVDMTPFTDNGYYDLAGVVNFASADLGNFTSANGYPESQVPGIPGTTGYTDQFAAEYITYIEFPKAGYYQMGVASDDCFRVYPTDKPPAFLGATLYVNTPAAIAGQRLPGDPAWSAGGWGGSTPIWPKPPVTAKVVYTTSLGSTPPAPLPEAADIAGNICLIDRGGIEFGAKAVCAQMSGAIGCIIVNNRQDLPISMGSGVYGANATIPVMMIHQNDGAILKAHLADPGGISVTVGWDPELVAGEYDNQGGRGTGDTWFLFGVPQPGVYPFRLAFNNGGSPYSCEWFTVDANGNRTLINDTVAGALKAYRARVAAQHPSLTIGRSGANVVVTFEGTLQAAGIANGTYTNVLNATSPYTNAPAATTFFRSFR
jgi:hypothetical protein